VILRDCCFGTGRELMTAETDYRMLVMATERVGSEDWLGDETCSAVKRIRCEAETASAVEVRTEGHHQ